MPPHVAGASDAVPADTTKHVALYAVGQRLSIYWEKEQEWFEGKVVKVEGLFSSPEHTIKYDDGDEATYRLHVGWKHKVVGGE